MRESFSQTVKQQLSEIEVKKKCCRFTDNAMDELNKADDCSSAWEEILQKCRCPSCHTVFLRRLFCLYGSVTSPEKAYHLDFTFSYPEEANTVQKELEENGFDFKQSTRRNKFVIYSKNSSVIEDFLVSIGASAAAFELMNSKIVHDFRNSVNRQVNCDTANIEKQLGAVRKYADAIRFLEESGKIDALSPELKETAKIRMENSGLSLHDLGNLFCPPVSKSGLRHRFERIYRMAERCGYVDQPTEQTSTDEDEND